MTEDREGRFSDRRVERAEQVPESIGSGKIRMNQETSGLIESDSGTI